MAQILKQIPKMLDSKHYPWRNIAPHKKRNIFVLGLGSNVAKPTRSCIAMLESAFVCLYKHAQIDVLRTSPIWRNQAFGYEAQDDFYNAIIICQSNLSLIEIYRLIFYIERKFGRVRKRAFKNAPRVLDIDIICFNDMHLRLPHLHLPHRGYKDRLSVLLPLDLCYEA